jgi:hypothetical protein
MMRRDSSVHRRHFLLGSGVMLGLPMLDIFMPGRAEAATAPGKFLAIVVNGNGVMQSGTAITGAADPERFWPTKTGTLTAAGLTTDAADRTTGLLAAHSDRLIMVRGIQHPFPGAGCDHAGGDAQLLTSSKLAGTSNKTVASSESIDTRIAREQNVAGRDPLTLHAGRYSPGGMGFDIPGYISYAGSQRPRAPEASPYAAYQKMVGLVDVNADEGKLIAQRRASVNDILRTQLKSLLGRTDLSANDRVRLDQHFQAVRDLEISFTATLAADKLAAMKQVDADPYNMDNHETIIRLHMDLMVLAISSGYTHATTLKIGDREDDHVFTVGGVKWDDTYHKASHRQGTDPVNRCVMADRIHAGHFKYFIDQLAAITTPTGKLIDEGVSVWTNQVANGNHSYTNVPFIVAGSGNGYLKTGQMLSLPQTRGTNAMLNTLLSAAGSRNAAGGPVDDFGDPSLPKGVISEIVA